jgi:hypothetical protein
MDILAVLGLVLIFFALVVVIDALCRAVSEFFDKL